MEELISFYDKDLNIIDVNETALRVFKFSREQVIGKNICDLVPNFKDSDRHKIYKEVLRSGKSVVYDELTVHPSLGNFTLLLQISKHGEGLRVSAVDITDKRKPLGIRWLLISGLAREKLIAYIKQHDSFYRKENFAEYTDAQLRAIALQTARRCKMKNK